MVALIIFPYVINLAADTEGLSSYVIMRCMTSSSMSHENPNTLNMYTVSFSYTRYEADQRRGYTRGEADWIKEVTYSSWAYRKVRLRPSLTSDWGNQTMTRTRRSQWELLYIGGKNK